MHQQTIAEHVASLIRQDQRVSLAHPSPSGSERPETQYVDVDVDANTLSETVIGRDTAELLLANGYAISGVQRRDDLDHDYRIWVNELTIDAGQVEFDYA